MLQPGDKAPAITLPLVGGGGSGDAVSLESLANGGSTVLVVFFKISCPVCQYSFPFLERLSKGSLPVVAVSQDDASGTAEFLEELGITIPTLLDERGRYPASSAYRISNVPSMYLVDLQTQRVLMSEAGFSKQAFEEWGRLAGVAPFLPTERIPVYRPG
jgi:peroxiredoxin